MFDNLFSPITINKTEIKNRIVFPSIGIFYSMDKKINDRYVEFYRERAKGGAGIVTIGPVGFDEVGSGLIMLSIGNDSSINEFARAASAIKNEGARAWIQLYHAGGYSLSMLIGGKQAIAPSALYSKYSKETPREMTKGDIEEVQENFVRAAERAREAGFDGVEIIGSAGYLISQFLSPLRNVRTDEYGGSFENRTRFPRELIQKMRKRLGPDYPVTIRIAGNDFVPGSNTSSEIPAIAKVYEEAGIDAINVTGGWHETRVPQLSMDVPRGAYSYLAKNVKAAVNVPVYASNRITTPYIAEQILKDGEADLINLGRVLIADPFWPQKAIEGRTEEIIPCVACSQGCMDELFNGRPVFCIANPRAGFEAERILKKTASPKKIMVIGAGPAGLEAAVRAAEAGHTVEVYERGEDIGGQLWIAGTPPHKEELWELVRYYESQLEKYQIPVYLETEVDMNFIKERAPEHVIVAEGAVPMMPPISGIDGEEILTAWDVLAEDPKLGRRIAVIGGGSVGLETAHFLSLKGTISPETLYFLFKYEGETVERLRELVTRGDKEVTVFEMQPKVGNGIGKSNKWVILGNLEQHGVKMITGAKVLSVSDGKVTYEVSGRTESLEFDNIINASGSKSAGKLSKAIEGSGIPFTVIGDAKRPARLSEAIHEGFLAVMGLN